MITARQIKELREKTGAGISDIRQVLEQSGGDSEKARRLIEERLGNAADKRAGRQTSAGAVDAYIHSDARMGVLIELLCETDFVARNAAFRTLAHDIAMHIAAMTPADSAALLEQAFIKDQAKMVGDLVKEAIGRFGENIKIGRFIRFEL